MITQRSQYRFVTPPDGVEINGGIMPARDAAGGGTSDELRGEDLCFLAEAGSRAEAYRIYGEPLFPPTVSDGMLGREADDAAHLIRRYPSYSNPNASSEPSYCIAGAPVIQKTYVKDVGASDTLAVIRAVLGNSVSPFVPASPEFVDSELDADTIRRMHYDLRKSGCYVHSGRIDVRYGVSPTYVQTMYYWDEAEHKWKVRSQRTEDGLGGQVISMFKNSTLTFDSYVYEHNWTLSALPPSSGSGIARLHGANAECYAVFLVDTSIKSSTAHVDAMVVAGSIGADGAVAIDPVTASAVRTMVAGAHGIPVTWADLPDKTSVSVSVSPQALIFHDPGIDTSGINWNWTPVN